MTEETQPFDLHVTLAAIRNPDLRRCIGSAKFGIEGHEAPVGDFPTQPSQKDGLGRMCKTHWKAYVQGLTRDREARKVAPGDGPAAAERIRESAIAAGAKVTVTRHTRKPTYGATGAAQEAMDQMDRDGLDAGARVAAEPETSPKLPETIAEVGTPEGQAALEAAAKEAQIARRGKPARSARNVPR